MHPDELLAKLTAKQFYDWILLYSEEPWGELRQDMRELAKLCIKAGMPESSLEFPYWPQPITLEEYQETIAEAERIRNGTGS